jgi:hypothetical protein
MDLHDLDWGNVPAWLGAGSLILADVVFMCDRTNSDRVQVDLVGAWATVAYERSAPDVSPRVETGLVTGHMRNASELPVHRRVDPPARRASHRSAVGLAAVGRSRTKPS